MTEYSSDHKSSDAQEIKQVESALIELADSVVSFGDSKSQVEAYVAYGRETSIRVYNKKIESLESAETLGVGIRYINDGKLGFAWSGQIPIHELINNFDKSKQTAREIFDLAKENSTYATYDEFVFLPTLDEVEPADLELFDPHLLTFNTKDKVELAFEVENGILSGSPLIKSVEQSNYGDGLTIVALATSTGIKTLSKRTGCYLAAYAIAGDDNESHTGGGVSVARNPYELIPSKVIDDSVMYSTRMVGATKPNSAIKAIVFDPKITSTFLALLSGALSGNSVAKKRSFFMDRLNESVGNENVTLVDDPTNPNAYGASIYDAEGLACRRNTLIENGVLMGFLHSTESAKRCDTNSTASATRSGYSSTPSVGPRSLMLKPGLLTQDEILAKVDSGVYVQSVTGVNSGVNPISGDFSVGIEGLVIKNGQLDEPIREATISSTMQRMLMDISLIGSDLNWLPGVATGQTVAISSMTMSGK